MFLKAKWSLQVLRLFWCAASELPVVHQASIGIIPINDASGRSYQTVTCFISQQSMWGGGGGGRWWGQPGSPWAGQYCCSVWSVVVERSCSAVSSRSAAIVSTKRTVSRSVNVRRFQNSWVMWVMSSDNKHFFSQWSGLCKKDHLVLIQTMFGTFYW